MPSVNRYKYSTIYKLVCNDGYYYIGSTITSLYKRFYEHKRCSKIHPNRKLYKHIHTIGWDNVKIVTIEQYSCNNIKELHKRENTYITLAKQLNDGLCLNKINSHTTQEEKKIRQSNYIKTHRDKLKEYFKQYNAKHSEKRNAYQKQYVIDNKESVKKARQLQYQKNKEEADEYSKQWCKEHPEKSRAYKKKWTENNYEKVQQKRRETREKMESIECECGGIFKPYNKSAHIKSKRHNNFINALTTVTV